MLKYYKFNNQKLKKRKVPFYLVVYKDFDNSTLIHLFLVKIQKRKLGRMKYCQITMKIGDP